MSHIVILYGEMGAGKSYTAERMAQARGWTFVEGDTLLPPNMLARIRRFLPVDTEMLSNYVLQHLGPELLVKAVTNDVVVAQALYRAEHRELLAAYLERHGHTVTFQCVKVPFVRHLRQLASRRMGALWVAYAILNKPFFQE